MHQSIQSAKYRRSTLVPKVPGQRGGRHVCVATRHVVLLLLLVGTSRLAAAMQTRVIHRLSNGHIHQLWSLYQREWWTKQRTLEKTQALVVGSQVTIGIVAVPSSSTTSTSPNGVPAVTPDTTTIARKDVFHTRTAPQIAAIAPEDLPNEIHEVNMDQDGQLIGFVRVLTDFTIKAFVFDVIVDSDYRGLGLGKQLMTLVLEHDRLAQVQQFELYCLEEMAPFYESQFGFSSSAVNSLVLMRRTQTKSTC